MKVLNLLCLVLVSSLLMCLGAEEVTLIQSFEGKYSPNKWPEDRAGEVVVSEAWKSEGKHSLRIDPGLMSVVDSFKTRNWKGNDILRIHIKNDSDAAVTVGFEIRDKHKGFRERHDSAFGVVPGVSTVDIDIAGGLWRGEENKPYLGKIKTPIELDLIKRILFNNRGDAPIYIDQIELVKVKKVVVDGGFAFDFGRKGTQVMAQMIGVTESDTYRPKKGFGITGKPSMLGRSMSFPTAMLGDGLAWDKGDFRVNLNGGKYIGLIAFERGGFWEDEYSAYTKASLRINGKSAHSHAFTTDGTDFLFQDTEILDLDNLVDDLIWPAHAVSEFEFSAAKGENVFALDVEDLRGYPLRVAGLIIAPNTKQGKEFIEFHKELQHKTIDRVFTRGDKSSRSDRQKPAAALVVEELPVGVDVYPNDWPYTAKGTQLAEKLAVAGQTLTFHLGVYAQKNLDVQVEAASRSTVKPVISHGRYMPMRNYGVGSIWLEINHYRPGASFTVGPQVTRSVIVEYKIPKDFGNGVIEDTLTVSAGKEKITLPVKINVSKVALLGLPIPVGLFMNALPISENKMDSTTWWKLQEDLLVEQMGAGLTAVSGGESLGYKVEDGDNVKISGDNAWKYIALAEKHGPIHAVVGYGGFFVRFKQKKKNPQGIGRAILAMEKERSLPPHYINSFDEPRHGTDQLEQVLSYLGPHKKAGMRTVGWSSWSKHEDIVSALAKNSYAVALNIHKAEHIEKLKALGTEPWSYNNGLDRMGMGLRLWRSIKLGMKGRMQWIGLFTQGFGFHNLDGREPSSSCFMVHRELGVLKTARWLGVREGLLDARIRLTLESLAKANDAALGIWSTDGYQSDADVAKWTNAKLEESRQGMLKRIIELSK